ncbi:hypothetical protein [Amycolatopsis sp. NPDC098790]|uniref:hypothetical protein n=1 Tax=Amycolatopsis sp. NPDC098790 TaxID=3363939 RepID=UPI0037F2FED1
MVVLDPAAFAQLDASRQQLGAKMEQIASLKRLLRDAAELLDVVEGQLPALAACGEPAPDDGCCPKHVLQAALAARRDLAVRSGARSGRRGRGGAPDVTQT